MADMMYRLVLRAQFENQAELTKAIEGLNQLQIGGAKVNVQMGGMGRTSSESMAGLARSVMSVGFMFNMMESALMRQEMATMMAENAQNRLNDAIQRYGANSEQARRATKQMESELAYLNNANIRANVSMGLMAINLVLQSKVLESATRAEIMHTAAKHAGTIASGAKTIAEHIETAAIWLKNAATSAAITLQAMLQPYLVPIMVAAGTAAAIAVSAATVPSKQEGGFITQTGRYTLHAGERVLSSKEVSNFKSLQTGGTIEKEGYFYLHTGEKVLSTTNESHNEIFASLLSTVKESTFTMNNMENSVIKERSSNNDKLLENNKTFLGSLLSTSKESNTRNIEKSVLKDRLTPSLQTGGTRGNTTLPTFNFETHLHIETDLDAALAEQNRRIKNEYRRSAT